MPNFWFGKKLEIMSLGITCQILTQLTCSALINYITLNKKESNKSKNKIKQNTFFIFIYLIYQKS